MRKFPKFSPEMRERAVRMAQEHRSWSRDTPPAACPRHPPTWNLQTTFSQESPHRRNGALHKTNLWPGLRHHGQHLFSGLQAVGLLAHVKAVLFGLGRHVGAAHGRQLLQDGLQAVTEHAAQACMSQGLMEQHARHVGGRE